MFVLKFWRNYQETILSIIEDKPRIEIPLTVFKFIILISFLQILMYLFHDQSDLNSDNYKLKSVFNITEMVSLVNVLNLKQDDNLSIIFYAITQILIYVYFFYVTALTLIKQYWKDFFAKNQTTIIKMNEFLNIYFTFYLNVFLQQYLEFNCSLIFCSGKSLLSSQRTSYNEGKSCQIQSWQLIMGTFGLVISILTALIISYYFRNYEFLETNALKRKASILFSLMILVRITIVFIDFSGQISISKQILHLFCQIYGILSLADYFVSIPFADQEISRFYLVCATSFEVIVSFSNVYFLTSLINGEEMFYMSILGSLILSVSAQQAFNYKYENILKGSWQREKIIPELDYYLEQIVLLAEQSIYSEEAKIKLQKAYRIHQSSCKISTCVCHSYYLLNTKSINEIQLNSNLESNAKDQTEQSQSVEKEINIRIIHKFVDSIFQWMFSQRCINQNTQQFEKLSLKYISFMIKYQNNPVRAYFELKSLFLKKNSYSLYFKIIQSIISSNIQGKIDNTYSNSYSGEDQSKSSRDQINQIKKSKLNINQKNELSVSSIFQIEKLSQKFIPQFLKVIEKKYEFWVNLQNGYKSIGDFQVEAIKLMKQVRILRIAFLQQMKQMQRMHPEVDNNIQFQKLTQIFLLFIANDTIKAINLEVLMNELKKRDSMAEFEMLKNISLTKGDICILEMSLSQNFGNIVSQKDDKTAQFFGFQNKDNFQKINHINDLMPDFIGRAHNRIVKSFIQGTSYRAKAGITTLSSFIKQNDGYLQPVKIYFEFSYTSPIDFRMYGVLLKKRQNEEYIIFHRSGKIVGLTKKIAKILFQEFHELPNGDVAVQRLNALLLIPRIIKRIQENRDNIFQDLKSRLLIDQLTNSDQSELQSNSQKSSFTMNTLIENGLGSLKFYSNPYSILRKFLSFLNKKHLQSNTKSKIKDKYENLDILDKQFFRILKQFQDYEEGQSTNRSNHDSSERLLSNRELQQVQSQELNIFKNGTGVKTISTQNSKKYFVMEYKMKFNYQLQFCFIDQSRNQGTQTSQKQNSSLIQNQTNQKNSYENQFKDIYFLLKMENITTKCRPIKKKFKGLEAFVRNLAKYFSSTTSIVQIYNQIYKLELKSDLKQQIENKAIDNSIISVNQEKSELFSSFLSGPIPQFSQQAKEQFLNFPKKMVRTLQNNNQNSNKQNNFEAGDDDDIDDVGISGHKNRSDKQMKNTSSVTSSQVQQSESESEDDDDDKLNYEKLFQQINGLIFSLKQNKESQDACNQALQQLIEKCCTTKSQIILLDPNYPIKKILQKRSNGFELSKELEIAFIENIFMQQYESFNTTQGEQFVQRNNHSQINNENEQTPMTFRHEICDLDISQDQTPFKNLPILESHTNRQGQKKVLINNIDTIGINNHNNHLTAEENILEVSQVSEINQFDDQSPNKNKHKKYIGQALDISNITIGADTQMFTQMNYPEQYTNFNTDTDKLAKPQMNKKISLVREKTSESFLNISQRPILNTQNIETNYQYTQERQQTYLDNQIQKDQHRISQQYSQLDQSNFQLIHSQLNQKLSLQDNQLNYSHENQVKSNINNQSSKQKDINQQSTFNSSKKMGNEGDNNSNDFMHQQAVAKLLNQQGIVEGKNSLQRASISSSNRTSSSYAGLFLKEIILKSKMPKSSVQYRIILFLFLFSFILLNIINIVIIKSDMGIFTSNVAVLRYPRQFLRDYGKALFGYYISLEIQQGYLYDDQGKVASAVNDYQIQSIQEYNSLLQLYSIQLVQLQQAQFAHNSTQMSNYSIYMGRQESSIYISNDLLFDMQQYFINCLNMSFTNTQRVDSFLYLRQNYFKFSSSVVDSVNYLVNDTINAVNSLISKFTIVIIIAIFGIIFVSIISLPVLKSINIYEEKIMMIVTRINFEASEIEKCKLQICMELIDINQLNWLNYNYFDIFNIQSQTEKEKNNLAASSSHHKPDIKSTKLKSNTNEVKNVINQLKDQSNNQLMNSGMFQNNSIEKSFISFNNQQSQLIQQQSLLAVKQNTPKDGGQKQQQQFKLGKNKNSKAKNSYLLQSKIANQSLNVFGRFITLLSLTIMNCIYFLIIIVYLTQSNDQLKVPVQMNQRSINLHVIMTNLKIATELLSFDYYIMGTLWPDYQITSLQNFFDQMNQSITQLNQLQQQNTDIIYGKNPFPSNVLNQMKDIYEGRGCQYLTKYKCQDLAQELGIVQIIADKTKFVTEYPEVLAPNQPPVDQLVIFLNSEPHMKSFIYSFQSEDELLDFYSTLTNDSISTVSLVIQDFLQNYLIFAGSIFSICIFLVITIHWHFLFNRIQEMNLLLTIIPEEKLQEDVTLHMIRQVHRL
ncbi:transmembrane protein, putative (macronuclear) [Tetrahymena thermophila SB210]|uniref:Transmembrane protein, putative n=1 Tax=Tetrahymena thermophila (strain SB210) TaxID=312017 RepID=Q22P43_TETTS|nr:transmembrane protein, putative [Tetrahymena thermophila SB210]EAR86968.3 transmembrane protein, putative [Tetrahymena thermophila SB210]|eukprot:XP_001007213.3 transmembrane protein, putative [Tetrahymena thermophila SB210]